MQQKVRDRPSIMSQQGQKWRQLEKQSTGYRVGKGKERDAGFRWKSLRLQ